MTICKNELREVSESVPDLHKMSKGQTVKVEMFAALMCRNKYNKTPLHLAVENNCLS